MSLIHNVSAAIKAKREELIAQPLASIYDELAFAAVDAVIEYSPATCREIAYSMSATHRKSGRPAPTPEKE